MSSRVAWRKMKLRPVTKGVKVVELAHEPGFGLAPLRGKGIVKAREERRVRIKMVIVKVGGGIERPAIRLARTAVARKEGIPDQRFDGLGEGVQKTGVHFRAKFTAQGVEDD